MKKFSGGEGVEREGVGGVLSEDVDLEGGDLYRSGGCGPYFFGGPDFRNEFSE